MVVEFTSAHTRLIEAHSDNPEVAARRSVEYLIPGCEITGVFPIDQQCPHGKPIWAVTIAGYDRRVDFVPAIGGDTEAIPSAPESLYVSDDGPAMRTRVEVTQEVDMLAKARGPGSQTATDRWGVLRWVLGVIDTPPSAIVRE